MTTPNDRASQRRPLSPAQHQQRKAAASKGGKALVAKYGPNYMGALHQGKGGRPNDEAALAKARIREAVRGEEARRVSRPSRKPAGWREGR